MSTYKGMTQVVAITSGAGGSGKTASGLMLSYAATRLGLLTTLIDGGESNADVEDRTRVQMSWAPNRAPTLDEDTWPVEWWTDPLTGFQLLPASRAFAERSSARIAADLGRAIGRARGLRDVIVIDLPQLDWNDPLLDILTECSALVIVLDHNAKTLGSPASFIDYLDASAVRRGRGMTRAGVRMLYVQGAENAAAKEHDAARDLAMKCGVGWLGTIPYVRNLWRAANEGDVIGGLSPAAKRSSLEIASKLFDVPIPPTPKRSWWKRTGGEDDELPPSLPRRPMVTYSPGFTFPPPSPVGGLPAPSVGSAAPLPAPVAPEARAAPTGSASAPLPPPTGEVPVVAPTDHPDDLGPRRRDPVERTAAPSIAVDERPRAVVVEPAKPGRATGIPLPPRVMMRTFAAPPYVEGEELGATATRVLFALEQFEGARRAATVAEAMGLTERHVQNQSTPLWKLGLVDRGSGSWQVMPDVRSDVRWMGELSGALLAATEVEVRLGLLDMLINALGEVRAPAFGGDAGDRNWSWAFEAQGTVVISACDRAVGELAGACRAAALAWVAMKEQGVAVPDAGRLVTLLLRVADLCPEEHGGPMWAAAAKVAAADGPALRSIVRGRLARLVAGGVDVSDAIVRLVVDDDDD